MFGFWKRFLNRSHSSLMSDNQYEYLKRQHYLATHMELTEENVIRVLEELQPYIEADGGFLEFVEIDSGTKIIKVRFTETGDTSSMTNERLLEILDNHFKKEILDYAEVVQVL